MLRSRAEKHSVDINHVEELQARSIGVETLAWHAMMQLQLDQKLTALGFSKVELAAAVGNIIGRGFHRVANCTPMTGFNHAAPDPF